MRQCVTSDICSDDSLRQAKIQQEYQVDRLGRDGRRMAYKEVEVRPSSDEAEVFETLQAHVVTYLLCPMPVLFPLCRIFHVLSCEQNLQGSEACEARHARLDFSLANES